MTFKRLIQKICIKPEITIHHLPAESLAPSSVKNSALPRLIWPVFDRNYQSELSVIFTSLQRNTTIREKICIVWEKDMHRLGKRSASFQQKMGHFLRKH
jgi:hypothetical protein